MQGEVAPVMTNCQLEIVGNESLNSIDRFDEFHVNLLFDRSIYRPMCTHMGYMLILENLWENSEK